MIHLGKREYVLNLLLHLLWFSNRKHIVCNNMLEYQHSEQSLLEKQLFTLKLFRIRLVASENRSWQLC